MLGLKFSTRPSRRLGAALLGCGLVALAGSGQAFAQTAVKFALDWKFEGPSAPYFVAIDKGFYKAEGLDVTVDTGPGSVAGIGRVAAGTYPLGFFDINSLVKFRDQNPDKAVKAVMMVYDRPPFAIVSLKSKGVAKPKDLEGKTLGAPAADGAFAQWKAFVAANKIDDSKVKIENVGFPVREPMLATGKVDAITGFSFSSHFNLLQQKGVKEEDVVTILMADHGLVLYGNAIMVNPEFAKANPKIVAGFVRATIKGVIETAKNPEEAIKSVMKRNETGDAAIELARLKMALRDNMVTPWVKANGVGGVDMDRLAKSLDQIGLTFDYTNRPKADDIFTSEFLPPASERKL
ncbi:MAG: ABC transporter substrate-binding protein [Beijerinckiaceae bacterium]|jgi:NitT/TauT family transport system substrate-binding protein|nr:ABC transporter substrate-binding protein [Beijerinckiaceae bacterium]MBX9757957.1 ABC transporter substrate-binding protein [Beijerinckiaceae bacterium]MDO9442164.1 ABC transporter substrate-binding protein [Beijerinckiaceae bacterium]